MSDLSWHQTKSITITIIVLLLTNIISSVWWAATITKDVDVLKEEPSLLERVIKVETLTNQNTRYLNRLAVILDRVNTTIDRIDREQAKRGSILNRATLHMDRQDARK